MNISAYISAFRLRTLPLASACIIMGSFLAYQKNVFSIYIFLLALLTAFCLQILSNLANDFGDSQNGADNENRVGPIRAVQNGLISVFEIKLAIYFFIFISFLSGLLLLFLSFGGFSTLFFFVFTTWYISHIGSLFLYSRK